MLLRTPPYTCLLAICCSMLIFTACKREPIAPDDYQTFHLPALANEIFSPYLNEVRIYRDSASGVYDTAICYRVDRGFIKSTYGDKVLFEEEYFSMNYYHSYYSNVFYYSSRLAIHSDNEMYFNISENGQAYLMRFPLVVGDSISNGNTSTYSVLKAFYPNIVIGDKVLEDVYFIKLNNMSSRMGSDADYYFAKNRGIVAIREYQTNKLWVLQ